jgi:hypothetical protein
MNFVPGFGRHLFGVPNGVVCCAMSLWHWETGGILRPSPLFDGHSMILNR